MLSSDIIEALKSYTSNLEKDVSFVVQSGQHSKREELLSFLGDIAAVSDRISLEERDIQEELRSPISFLIEADGEDTGIRFSGIPGGHEFNSLVLALLQAGGTALKLDEDVQALVAGNTEELNFEVFISLSCHNCPEVVQTLNQFALLNPQIKTDMIDGGLFQSEVEARDIQGVPSVYLNGEPFANGKVDAASLIDKLLERNPDLKNGSAAELPEQDVTVIGGGPAGVSAAIYAARKGLAVTVVADRLGGQVRDTQAIENLISVPETTGTELSAALMKHMQEYDITLKENVRVETIVSEGNRKRISLSTGASIPTKTVIVASGARWRELNVPGEKENIGNGVAYCPHCDGPFFKGKDIAVVGGGNSGIEAALDLAGIVKSVTVFEFLSELKADKVLVAKARQKANIDIITNAATRSIEAENGNVSAICYEDRATGEIHSRSLSGVFVQIGLVPNSQFLGDLVETTGNGEIVIDAKSRTSEAGIFACGDVTTVPYKQIVVAMGEGSKAALSAFEYLLTEYEADTSTDDEAQEAA